MVSKMEQELRDVTELAPKRKESRQEFLSRLVKAAEALDENTAWEELSQRAQDWVNKGIDADQNGRDISEFPDDGDEDDSSTSEAEEGGEEAEASEAETEDEDPQKDEEDMSDEDKKPAKKTTTKTAKTPAEKPKAAKAETKAPAKAAAKATNGTGTTRTGDKQALVMKTTLKNPKKSGTEIAALIEDRVKPSTTITIRAAFISSVNFLAEQDLLKGNNPFAGE